MITTIVFLFFLGLVVLGPKKTIEIARELGRVVTHLKHAVGRFEESATDDDPSTEPGETAQHSSPAASQIPDSGIVAPGSLVFRDQARRGDDQTGLFDQQDGMKHVRTVVMPFSQLCS